jgi:hypothetical protein
VIVAHAGHGCHPLPGVAARARRGRRRRRDRRHDRHRRFDAAFRERAPEKLVDLVAADCVMEGTGPAPDGDVWTGCDECPAGWQDLASDPTIRFEAEHVDVDGRPAPSSAGGSRAPRTTGA